MLNVLKVLLSITVVCSWFNTACQAYFVASLNNVFGLFESGRTKVGLFMIVSFSV